MIAIGGPLHGSVITKQQAEDNEYTVMQYATQMKGSRIDVEFYTYRGFWLWRENTFVDALLRVIRSTDPNTLKEVECYCIGFQHQEDCPKHEMCI